MPSSSMTIRTVMPADLPQLLALYRHLVPEDEAPSVAMAEDILERFQTYSGSAIFVGELEGRLVVSCSLIVVPNLTRGGRPYGLIENVVTHAEFRQRGFGKLVLDRASDAAWEAGCYKVMLLAGSKTPEILSFYLGAGFEPSKTGFQKRRLPPRAET